MASCFHDARSILTMPTLRQRTLQLHKPDFRNSAEDSGSRIAKAAYEGKSKIL
uniref:Uncharacterized protein n=1 Tax=Solanum tuberosum TaxID=4113 RepID=M1CM06_SOLTU